jgi:DNA-binding transcriptional MerR regulator
VELTLDDLTREVANRIRRAGVTQGNGQVSALPDQRTLRYYTTIGLLDRPLAVRGRQAVYGHRHVLQAVAVKRLQAAGLSLEEIQTRLAGLPTPHLALLAEADKGDANGPGRAVRAPRTAQWWAVAPSPPSPPTDQGAVPAPVTMTAIPLDGAVTVLLPTDRRLAPSELAAIRVAAAPLIAHLAAAGLAQPHLDEKERS